MSNEKPTKEEIDKFVKIIDQLERYEAQQRFIRGYGCFDERELPIKEYQKVRKWLVNKNGDK